MYEPSSKKVDKETMKKMLKKMFKNLVQKNIISFEIHKITKDKNKKLVSQFIDHINVSKTNAINNLMKAKSHVEGLKLNDKKFKANNKKVGGTMIENKNKNKINIKSTKTKK